MYEKESSNAAFVETEACTWFASGPQGRLASSGRGRE